MVRTVRVDLEVGGNPDATLEATAGAARHVDEKVNDLNQELKETERDAAKAAAAMKLLGDSTDDIGNKVDAIGNKSTAMDALNKRITDSRIEVRRLGEEFNRTGDSSVFEKLGKTTKDLKGLERIRKDLTGALEMGAQDGGKEAGKTFVDTFRSSISGFLSTPILGPLSVGAIAAAIIAGAPILGAALNGVLLSGIGLGGIALGIVGQIKSPDVHDAFVSLGHGIEVQLATVTSSMKGPLIDAARIFGATFDAIMPHLRDDLSGLALYIRPLAAGIQQLFQNMMPGLDKAFAAAGPMLMTLSSMLPGLGKVISQFFADISSEGAMQGAQQGLRTLVIAIEAVILGLGRILSALSNAYSGIAGFGEAVSGSFAKAFDWMPGVSHYLEGIHNVWENIKNGPNGDMGVTKFKNLGTSVEQDQTKLGQLEAQLSSTKVTTDTLAAHMAGNLFNAMMSVDQASLAVHQSQTAVKDSFAQNGLAIDKHTHQVSENTKAGQANIGAVLGSVTANMGLYQAQVAAGISAADATANYETNTRALHYQLRAAGLTEAQVNSLIGKYKDVPKSVNTAIAVQGLTEAINNLGNLLAKAYGLDGKNFGFTVTEYLVTADNRTSPTGRGNRWGGIYEHADMGLLNAGIYSPAGPARYAFAEPATGGEGFVPRFGNYQRSTAIIDQEARWYGGRFVPGGSGGTQMYAPTYHVHVHALDARAAGPVVIEAIKSYERSNGTNWRGAP